MVACNYMFSIGSRVIENEQGASGLIDALKKRKCLQIIFKILCKKSKTQVFSCLENEKRCATQKGSGTV